MEIRKNLRIGLAASRSHLQSPDGILARLLNDAKTAITQHLQPELIAIGGTYDAIRAHGLLEAYGHLHRFPNGREGGLMKLVSRTADPDPARALDAIIYLVDPTDQSSVFPEAVALKRQAIIHGKPFLSTLAGAREWLELEAFEMGAVGDTTLDETFFLEKENVALIAHDAKKQEMLMLVERHFAVLDRFGQRFATGTTGGLLNELARKIKGEDAGRNWVKPFLSGPMGGDAQIAELVLDRQCRRILFLEDPHVARQHEADIQLLERAARTVSEYASCVSEASCIERWCRLLEKRILKISS
ncbi:methylglyoxal synthase [Oxalobacteraceae bacterium R-40]|uniref:Methylglyoxal synthase n=1 Tax=Keguizhuia sedimenti TaxID=3064264 RepID=A0ABU1BNJ6_9BURK|nr:methylglyoxal synthase [Oxalobacteraceae bacterium R-40]